MTLQDLISELQDLQETYGPNIKVMSSSNYGDISRTEQLNEIESIEANFPVESAYSHSGLAFGTSDESDDSDTQEKGYPKTEQVIVLRYNY